MPLTDPTSRAKADLATISNFCTQLALRSDGDRVRARLAEAFVAHHSDLWPDGDVNATPQWIGDHIDEILAVCERLWGEATCLHTVHGFLDRMRWLPELLAKLGGTTTVERSSTAA